jgi:FMN reductase
MKEAPHMARIVTISGSLSRVSKTRSLAESVQRLVAARVGEPGRLVDVGELASTLAVRSREEVGPEVSAALAAIENADLLIAATPVYKGSFGGLFKHLIDLVDFRALDGVPVALLAVGGSERHALVVEHQLRPLFASFNAATLPTGVFVLDRSIEEGRIADPAVSARLDSLVEQAVDALRRRITHPAFAKASAA